MYALNIIKNQELKLMDEGGDCYLRFENVKISFCDNLKCTRFDSDDLDEVNLLRGQAKNENNNFEFSDYSLKEPFDSENAEYIKRGIREKIDKASVTIVYLTNDSAKSKWVDWEIEESLKRGKGVIGVHKGDTLPNILPKKFTEHGLTVVPWKHKDLSEAIEFAAKKKT